MTHDVFISHSKMDRPVAEQACLALERAGHLCWMAPRNIVPGQDYGEAIVDGISGSRIFLLIISAASVESVQVRRETERAASAGLTIIPFRIEDVKLSKSLEYFVSSAHWLDALTPPLEPHLDYLTAIVGRLLDGGDAPPIRPLTAPPQPMPPRPASRAWLPILLAGTVGLAGLAAVSFYVMRPAAARTCTAEVPDVAQTGFVRRATPTRGDKPLWLRAGPSPRAERLTAIGPDEIFRVSADDGRDWLSAQLCDGTTGFVARRFVSVLDGGPPR